MLASSDLVAHSVTSCCPAGMPIDTNLTTPVLIPHACTISACVGAHESSATIDGHARFGSKSGSSLSSVPTMARPPPTATTPPRIGPHTPTPSVAASRKSLAGPSAEEDSRRASSASALHGARDLATHTPHTACKSAPGQQCSSRPRTRSPPTAVLVSPRACSRLPLGRLIARGQTPACCRAVAPQGQRSTRRNHTHRTTPRTADSQRRPSAPLCASWASPFLSSSCSSATSIFIFSPRNRTEAVNFSRWSCET